LLPFLYLAAALTGSIIASNSRWTEAREGTSIYIADNGIHTDIIMPVRAHGLDWSKALGKQSFADLRSGAPWIAIGSGEREVYLDTPRWRDIRLRTIVRALAGGPRVIHVEYLTNPDYAAREIRLRPEEYRRLWAAIHADFALDRKGRPLPIDHQGYGSTDAFYAASSKASALRPCNVVVANWLRLAGVKTSLWPPFAQGLVWRYRKGRLTTISVS
jgi:uncharacterized protein (TIGR02117 family)